MMCEHTASSNGAYADRSEVLVAIPGSCWRREGCTALSVTFVESIVSDKVGARQDSNRSSPAQRILHLRAVSARAPVATRQHVVDIM